MSTPVLSLRRLPLLLLLLPACGGDRQPVETESASYAITNGGLFDTQFVSNRITISTWQCWNETNVAHPTVPCSVASDHVLIGGSAHTTTLDPRAFLTASYPDTGLTTWTASSKDHGVSFPHRLNVMATGMKVTGMTPAQLRANLFLQPVRTSGVASHPSLTATAVPSNRYLISMGAKVNWTGPGNLLTGVWETGVKAKDHEYPDPASINIYELWINRVLPVGPIDVVWKTATAPVIENGLSAANVRPDGGFAAAGASVFSVWWNPGRLILAYGFHPGRTSSNGYECWTGDHLFPSKGQALCGMSQIRMTP